MVNLITGEIVCVNRIIGSCAIMNTMGIFTHKEAVYIQEAI